MDKLQTRAVSSRANHQANPQVSVVVPLYNKAAYIARTLRSILAQTVSPLEVIVINDGSQDEGPAIVQQLAETQKQDKGEVNRESEIQIRLVHQENAGPGAARNHGLRLAQGSHIAFLDADDEWFPLFLERSLDRLRAHPDCVLSVSGQVRGAQRQNWSATMAQLGLEAGVWRLPTNLTPELHKPSLDILHSGAIVCDRTVVNQFGGFYSQAGCRYGEDLYLWLQIILHYPIYRDFGPLMWYHTEASDLAVWRQTCPPWPMLLEPDPIRAHCPQPYQELLEQLLANYALIAAYRCATQGDLETARTLLKAYPRVQASAARIWQIRLEMLISAVPNLRRSLRQLKRSGGEDGGDGEGRKIMEEDAGRG
ncbi:MAG: glycosyltransferase family A protein [Cyanobacteria bacterium J06635_1]